MSTVGLTVEKKKNTFIQTGLQTRLNLFCCGADSSQSSTKPQVTNNKVSPSPSPSPLPQPKHIKHNEIDDAFRYHFVLLRRLFHPPAAVLGAAQVQMEVTATDRLFWS